MNHIDAAIQKLNDEIETRKFTIAQLEAVRDAAPGQATTPKVRKPRQAKRGMPAGEAKPLVGGLL